jgi:putative transcription factor
MATMKCEVCGGQIFGKPYNVVIDGAKMLVCSKCVQFTQSSVKQITTIRKVPMKRERRSYEKLITEEAVLVENYGVIIRKGREKLGLTHKELSRKIGEKISLLQKLETQKMIPDLAVAKKLEGKLRIQLLVPPSKTPSSRESIVKQPIDLTLGDIVVVQKQKSDDVEES